MANKKGKNWVDYKKLKEQINLKMVLDHYQVELKKAGKNYVGCCPIHEGTNPKQFSVNLERSIWKCFGNCQKGGNVLDFVSAMEGEITIHESALKLKAWFSLDDQGGKVPETKNKNKLVRKKKEEPKQINPPLPFTLKNLEDEHPFFEEEGLCLDTIEYYGLGFCRKGMMKNRIVIPIHNRHDELIAYCGRAVDPELSKEEGKYKLPSSENGFLKSHVLYNLNRQNSSIDELILVESFKTVWKFDQLGIGNVVTPLGSNVSTAQADILSEVLVKDAKILIVFDGDESGRNGAEEALKLLGQRFFVKVLDISDYALKPHQLTEKQMNNIIHV